MRIKDKLSRERIVSVLKSSGKLRIKISHSSIITFSALLLILFIAFTIRIFPMYWEIQVGLQVGSMHLSEFDPYWQYSLTDYMVKNGFISPYWGEGWTDHQRWYPQGINMARSYPALPMTAAFFYVITSALGIDIPLMSFCALFPAITGMLACLIIYFLGKDIGGKPVGLLSALFLALSPSYLQRTSLGFFDDETIGILSFLLFLFFFLRAIKDDRPLASNVKYALASGVTLGYFCVGWGAAFYAIGITMLFAFALILLKRYTQRLLLSYSLTFGIGLFIAMSIPYLSTKYLITVAILPVAGVFALLCICEVFHVLASTKWKIISVIVFLVILIGGFSMLWHLGYMRSIAGKFISVINPLVREGSPLVESVAEHRISAWGPIYYDFGVVIIFFIASFYFLLRDPNNRNLFLLIFGLTSLYFACSMVRLLVLMAPAFCLLAALGITRILKPFITLLKEPPKIGVKKKYGLQHVGKEFSGAAVFLIFLILMTNFVFPMPKVYRQAWSPVTISAGSLPIAPSTPVQEWLDMLNWVGSNLEATTVVCSWWDYGYWLSILGNVTSLADNATINTTQIQNIGFTFMANETQALKMLELYDAKYILVFTTTNTNGYWIGYGDEGKWMWMARISGKAHDRFMADGFMDEEYSWTDEEAFGRYNSTEGRWDWSSRPQNELKDDLGMNSTIYKLMAWGKHRWCENHGVGDPEQQYWTDNNLTDVDIQPKYFKEAYFAGVEGSGYGGIVPLVCLYEIDWEKYESDFPSG